MQLVNSAGQPVLGRAGLPPGANATATMQLARQIAAQQAQLAPGAAGAVNGSAQQQLMNSLAQQGSLASQVAGAAAASAAAQNQQILSAAGLEDPNAKKADS